MPFRQGFCGAGALEAKRVAHLHHCDNQAYSEFKTITSLLFMLYLAIECRNALSIERVLFKQEEVESDPKSPYIRLFALIGLARAYFGREKVVRSCR